MVYLPHLYWRGWSVYPIYTGEGGPFTPFILTRVVYLPHLYWRGWSIYPICPILDRFTMVVIAVTLALALALALALTLTPNS